MPDDSQTTGSSSSLFVPLTLKQKFPEIIDLILRSESMNDEERQYWIDILPVMTPEQTAQLKTILVQEREQLAAIDAKYSKDIAGQKPPEKSSEEIGQARRERVKERSTKEHESETTELQEEAEILRKVQDL